jgi:hypothetical protein
MFHKLARRANDSSLLTGDVDVSAGPGVEARMHKAIASVTWPAFTNGVLRHGALEPHWVSQVHSNNVCKLKPTYVITTEHLDADVALLLEKLNRTAHVPHLNPSLQESRATTRAAVLDVISPELATKIAERYSADFSTFAYSTLLRCAAS